MELTETGLLSLTALSFGFLAGVLSCVLRSRCTVIECCFGKCTRAVIESPNTDVVVA